jgi:enterochelin esterase family protein
MRYFVAGLVLAVLSSAATVTNNIEYVKRPSGPLLLDAAVPDGQGPFPAVIIVHGGGFARGNKVTYVPPIFQPLTQGNFAWFSIDYRLAPTVRVQDQIEDVKSALAWVYDNADRYKVDRKRIALLGESAGAYLVDYVAMTAPQNTPVAAVVSFYGPADLTLQHKEKPMPEPMRTFFGVSESNAETQLRAVSPRYLIRQDLPPFLLLHGTADEQVPYEQSPRFCEALKAAGNQCELYTVPGARHGMEQWEQHADQQAYKGKVVEWLKTTLAGPQTSGPDPGAYYHLAPDAMPQAGVPQGEIRGPFTLPSQAYPGTQHTYWVYVPAQYDPAVPASLMIYNDGQAFMNPEGDVRAQFVMDNLIFRREIPVMIGVFINPGRRPDQPEPTLSNWGDRDTNRPTEYNTLDDRYARVIVDELLPALRKDYNLSPDPERHGIGGSSSGAIAAFTVAWQRPDQFRKVLSNVGSFTNLRGGNAYPDIIRKSEKKPLRVFLVDGRNDNRALKPDGSYDATRDWFYQNVRMQQALTEKSYDLNYSWGIQRHGQKMLETVFPEMMRWLWRDQGVSTDPRDAVERSLNAPRKPSS